MDTINRLIQKALSWESILIQEKQKELKDLQIKYMIFVIVC